jgi:alanyl-tRNA synthetase
MVPFKPYSRIMKPEVHRAVTSQKVRPDERYRHVGRTARHHSSSRCSEISAGAITSSTKQSPGVGVLTDVIGLDGSRLYATIYKDTRKVSVWRNTVGLPDERIYRFDKDENFWFMGTRGHAGRAPRSSTTRGRRFPAEAGMQVGCNCDRFLEYGTVFTQFDLQRTERCFRCPRTYRHRMASSV